MSPIGVGFFTNDADGLFHSQRLQLLSDVRCTKMRDRAGRDSLPWKGVSERGHTQSMPEILTNAEVSLVWIPADRDLLAATAILQAGKDVLLGMPNEVSSEGWRQLVAAARGAGRNILVAALHRWDGQFRTVRSQMLTEELGSIRELRRISRQFVPGESSAGHVVDNPESVESPRFHDQESQAFQIKWFEMLDELLLLVPSRASSVWARPTGHGRLAWVAFADGCQACLELDQRSLAPLETGWILEGTAGGYAAGRRFRAAGDYELVDVPVEMLPTDRDAFYNSLVSTVRDTEPFPVTTDAILRGLVLRDAIDVALQTGQVVDVAGV